MRNRVSRGIPVYIYLPTYLPTYLRQGESLATRPIGLGSFARRDSILRRAQKRHAEGTLLGHGGRTATTMVQWPLGLSLADRRPTE